MGDFKFANWRAGRIVHFYNNLVDICLPGDELAEERISWRSVASLYRDCIMVCLIFVFICQPFNILFANISFFFFFLRLYLREVTSPIRELTSFK